MQWELLQRLAGVAVTYDFSLCLPVGGFGDVTVNRDRRTVVCVIQAVGQYEIRVESIAAAGQAGDAPGPNRSGVAGSGWIDPTQVNFCSGDWWIGPGIYKGFAEGAEIACPLCRGGQIYIGVESGRKLHGIADFLI